MGHPGRAHGDSGLARMLQKDDSRGRVQCWQTLAPAGHQWTAASLAGWAYRSCRLVQVVRPPQARSGETPIRRMPDKGMLAGWKTGLGMIAPGKNLGRKLHGMPVDVHQGLPSVLRKTRFSDCIPRYRSLLFRITCQQPPFKGQRCSNVVPSRPRERVHSPGPAAGQRDAGARARWLKFDVESGRRMQC